MSDHGFTESVVEDAALAWLETVGYTIKHGPDISPGGDTLTLTLILALLQIFTEEIMFM